MFFARLAGVLLVIGLALLAGAYLVTRDRRYLRWLWLMLQVAAAGAVLFLVLYAAERLLMVI